MDGRNGPFGCDSRDAAKAARGDGEPWRGWYGGQAAGGGRVDGAADSGPSGGYGDRLRDAAAAGGGGRQPCDSAVRPGRLGARVFRRRCGDGPGGFYGGSHVECAVHRGPAGGHVCEEFEPSRARNDDVPHSGGNNGRPRPEPSFAIGYLGDTEARVAPVEMPPSTSSVWPET